jgi:hypothetical protein
MPRLLLRLPGKGACKEIDDRLDQHRASFETAASQLPQDDEFFPNAITELPHAEERRKGASRSTHGRIATTISPRIPDPKWRA